MSESNSTIGDELLDRLLDAARTSIKWWEVDINDAGPEFQTLHMYASHLLTIVDRALQQRDQLLEALRNALPVLELEVETRGSSDLLYEIPASPVLDAARAAIAKAEGRSDE